MVHAQIHWPQHLDFTFCPFALWDYSKKQTAPSVGWCLVGPKSCFMMQRPLQQKLTKQENIRRNTQNSPKAKTSTRPSPPQTTHPFTNYLEHHVQRKILQNQIFFPQLIESNKNPKVQQVFTPNSAPNKAFYLWGLWRRSLSSFSAGKRNGELGQANGVGEPLGPLLSEAVN